MRDNVRRLLGPVLIGLGLLFSGILVFDLVGYRALGEERYCPVVVTPVSADAGDWTLRIEVPDGGSGCVGPQAVCRGTRIIFPDPSRSC